MIIPQYPYETMFDHSPRSLRYPFDAGEVDHVVFETNALAGSDANLFLRISDSNVWWRLMDHVLTIYTTSDRFVMPEDISQMFEGFAYVRSFRGLDKWDTSHVRNMHSLFKHCDALEYIDVSGWDTSNVEDMAEMFMYTPMYGTHDTPAEKPILDLSSWDVSHVRDMMYMFAFTSFSKVIMKNWNLASLECSDLWDICSNVEFVR